MKIAKRLAIVGSMLGALGILVACGNGDGESSGKAEIEFFNQKKEMQGTLDEIIKDFEKENPDIKVKFTNVPDPGTVLKTRISSGDIPDVINTYPMNADFKEWAKNGIFEDLTGKEYLNNLTEGAAEAYALDDKVYNVPLTSNASGIYYNKTKFEELGLEAPKTFAEFETLVNTIKDEKEVPFALALTQSEGWMLMGYHQLAWAVETDGGTAANEALRFSPKGAIKPSDPVFNAVADKLDLLANNPQKNARGASYDDVVALFAKGEALMLPNGTWALPAINNQNPEFEIGMFPFPGNNEGEELVVGGADLAVSINESSKNKEAANKFVEYLTTKEAMQKYYDVDGAPTSVKSVETEGKFPETEGVTQHVFTDKQFIWLNSEWTSEVDFHYLTVDYVSDPNRDKLAASLNSFFDPMKE